MMMMMMMMTVLQKQFSELTVIKIS